MAADRTAQRRDRNRESKPGSSRAPEFGEDHLLALQCELTGRGVKCELDVRPAWPRLRIHGPCEISRAVAEFENSVVAASYSDGWWFSWPWAEKISPVTDVSAAAERIEPFIAGGAERGTPHVSRNVLDT